MQLLRTLGVDRAEIHSRSFRITSPRRKRDSHGSRMGFYFEDHRSKTERRPRRYVRMIFVLRCEAPRSSVVLIEIALGDH